MLKYKNHKRAYTKDIDSPKKAAVLNNTPKSIKKLSRNSLPTIQISCKKAASVNPKSWANQTMLGILLKLQPLVICFHKK